MREGELANTRAPLTRASRLYDCVEIDVARTNDGALVAMHGRDVRRFTRGALSDVGEVSRDELEMWNADGAEALDSSERWARRWSEDERRSDRSR